MLRKKKQNTCLKCEIPLLYLFREVNFIPGNTCLGCFLVSPLTSMILEGGYFHQNRTWMCLPDLENLTFSIPIFCLISTHQYTIFERKYPILTKLGAFYNNLLKIHPVLYNLGSLVSDENPSIAVPNFVKSAPKGRHIYAPYTISMWEPPLSFECPPFPGKW